MERITDDYVFFWNSIFSNWHSCSLTFESFGESHQFSNSEQAFMWCKAKFFEDDESAKKILKEPNPRENKKLGRLIKNFDSEKWMTNSYRFMVDVNMAKFSQNEEFKTTLLSTDDKIIVEASPYDKIWGIGLHWKDDDVLDESKWNGLNLLGKTLIQVRTNLK